MRRRFFSTAKPLPKFQAQLDSQAQDDLFTIKAARFSFRTSVWMRCPETCQLEERQRAELTAWETCSRASWIRVRRSVNNLAASAVSNCLLCLFVDDRDFDVGFFLATWSLPSSAGKLPAQAGRRGQEWFRSCRSGTNFWIAANCRDGVTTIRLGRSWQGDGTGSRTQWLS